ncbi:MAG: SprT family zinc-dependent metalloprotease [Phascolarctobacterium sp.]|nr:SprT family zinc-dependent metalloprotease [Phascolarctobacterium sp.]
MSIFPFDYTLVRSARRSLGVIIKDGQVIVRAPNHVSQKEIEHFLENHQAWVEKHLALNQKQMAESQKLGKLSHEELQKLADEALKYIPQRVKYFAPIVGVKYKKITIRNQKTRWGSATAQGNLNFNCLLMLAPKEVIDSVVVHELCHLIEMNHSPRFYAEVLRVMPNYYEAHKWLKENGTMLMERNC